MKHDSLLSYFSIMLYLLVIKRKVVDGGMKMEYKQRLYHLFSACGLNCGLFLVIKQMEYLNVPDVQEKVL